MARSGGDGKELEELVSTIERVLVPSGFTVERNQREYDDDGVQVAEFDITIRGNVGSTPIACLIECRNRPSQGRAPTSWIRELVGRKLQSKFDKVIAVSTTGFAAGAIQVAATANIALREMNQIAQIVPELTAWFHASVLHNQEARHMLTGAHFHIGENETVERAAAALAAVAGKNFNKPLLRSIRNGTLSSPVDVFHASAQLLPQLCEDLLPNQAPKPVIFSVNFTDEDYYVVDTTAGPVRITNIDFSGELAIIETTVPLSQFSEYRSVENKESVSQTASFTFPLKGERVTLDFHHLTGTGQIHLGLRRQHQAPETEGN